LNGHLICANERCYPSDMTDAEWALIEPVLPVPACQTRAGGRPEKWPRREIVDAINYVNRTGSNAGTGKASPTSSWPP
jgi:transposase